MTNVTLLVLRVYLNVTLMLSYLVLHVYLFGLGLKLGFKSLGHKQENQVLKLT